MGVRDVNINNLNDDDCEDHSKAINGLAAMTYSTSIHMIMIKVMMIMMIIMMMIIMVMIRMIMIIIMMIIMIIIMIIMMIIMVMIRMIMIRMIMIMMIIMIMMMTKIGSHIQIAVYISSCHPSSDMFKSRRFHTVFLYVRLFPPV